MRIVAAGSVALMALAFSPGLLFHFDITPKIVVLAGAAMCAALMSGLGSSPGIGEVLSDRRATVFAALIAVQALWFGVTTAISTERSLSVYGSTWRRDGWLTHGAALLLSLYLLGWMLREPGGAVTVLRAWTYSGGVLAVYVVLQYFGLDPLLDPRSYRVGDPPFEIVRPPGTFGHADYVAAWLVSVIFAGIALANAEPRRWMRRSAGAIALVAGFAVILTGTRSALVGVAAGAIAMAALWRPKIGRRQIAGAVLALGLLAGFVASPAGQRIRARLHWIGEEPAGGARLLLWRDSLRMCAHALWFGTGPETFGLRFPQYQSVELARQYPDYQSESPHNLFLDELASRGLPGLLILCAQLGFVLTIGARAGTETDGPRRAIRIGMVGATVAIAVCAQFAVLIPATLFALLLAEVLVVAPTGSGGTVEARGGWRERAGWRVVSVLFAAAFAIYGARLAVGDYRQARAAERLGRGDAAGAQEAYRAAVRWRPAGGTDDVIFARRFAQAGAWNPAFESANRAVRAAEDRQNAWYTMAEILAARNDATGVERSLRLAIQWAPQWFKPHWKLAEVLALEGKRQAATEEAALAVKLDGGKDEEVRATAARLGVE